ncbi:unnamed protein product [Litomosoides sigmodontis]|uniref:Uncharacterized protein n=1 Tax=Litomosoides sigmodontis TaxID=42156 RepID=A0A3P6S913_LITSI|nr:unnamed protein product [Litomosoides sigmodontis]
MRRSTTHFHEPLQPTSSIQPILSNGYPKLHNPRLSTTPTTFTAHTTSRCHGTRICLIPWATSVALRLNEKAEFSANRKTSTSEPEEALK